MGRWISSADRPAILSRAVVLRSIEDGDAIVIYKCSILKLNLWLQHHPGGKKTILHMVGRDATDEINGFHSSDTIKSMLRYRIGVLEDWWENITPPVQRSSADKKILEVRGIQDEHNGVSKDTEIFPARNIFNGALRQRTPDKQIVHSSNAHKENQVSPPGLHVLDENGAVVVDDFNEVHPRQQKLSQDEVVASFRDLIIQMENDGLYNCNYSAYLSDIFRISTIFVVMLFFLHRG